MDEIICNIEVLTPMFLGGAPQMADGKPICELRSQSIKGVIRYWYRTLIGPNRLKEENKLFGSSDENIGVSKVKIMISDKSKLLKFNQSKFAENNKYVIKHKGLNVNPLDYLAYGPVDKRKIVRGAFSPGSVFTLKFLLMSLKDNQKADFYKALYLMLNFGGLGSRSRKGYGALKLLNENEVFSGHDWFVNGNTAQTLKKIINNRPPVSPLYSKEYSYLDTDTRFWLSNEISITWEECLSRLGKDYHTWRQVLPVADGRENLGTPLLHGKNGVKDQRRASSYFLTVFKLTDNKYKYGVLHIPSNYSDNMIPFNVQQEHHVKFQKEIDKTATREV